MQSESASLAQMRQQAEQAARTLRFLANPHRLLLLCALVTGEQSAGALQAVCGLSQSATSQHLARLRADGVITVRRVRQQALYSLSDPAVTRLLATLHDLYCSLEESP